MLRTRRRSWSPGPAWHLRRRKAAVRLQDMPAPQRVLSRIHGTPIMPMAEHPRSLDVEVVSGNVSLRGVPPTSKDPPAPVEGGAAHLRRGRAGVSTSHLRRRDPRSLAPAGGDEPSPDRSVRRGVAGVHNPAMNARPTARSDAPTPSPSPTRPRPGRHARQRRTAITVPPDTGRRRRGGWRIRATAAASSDRRSGRVPPPARGAERGNR